MILYDTGVIVAANNPSDPYHAPSMAVLDTVQQNLVTTWLCVTETMYLLGSHTGHSGQEKLRRWLEISFLELYIADQNDARRACELMRKYFDAPMDFADASLVVAAERTGISRVLTLDRHFYSYRIHGNLSFEVLP